MKVARDCRSVGKRSCRRRSWPQDLDTTAVDAWSKGAPWPTWSRAAATFVVLGLPQLTCAGLPMVASMVIGSAVSSCGTTRALRSLSRKPVARLATLMAGHRAVPLLSPQMLVCGRSWPGN